jgi:hypothetical protein
LVSRNIYKLDEATQKYIASPQQENWDKRAAYTSAASSPKILSLDTPEANCAPGGEGLCKEGAEGISVCANNLCHTTENLTSTTGRLKVELKYYGYADNQHMPIIRKVVDYGDGPSGLSIGEGFYKNHRGKTSNGQTTNGKICGSDANQWGLDPQACDPRYFLDTHTYICSAENVIGTSKYPTCGTNGVYPCQDGVNCRFKPRVQLLDNWEQCNGTCVPSASTHSGNYCMNNSLSAPTPANSECIDDGDITKYIISNPNFAAGNKPWTEYGGEIIIKP